MKSNVVMKQLKLNILILLLTETDVIKENNCCLPGSMEKKPHLTLTPLLVQQDCAE